ncbi:MAG: site-specific DNA-methyltransferase [Nitrospira sp.]|nr:site-specific DNA-methyltransferase [Nitrospira sp.]
MQSKTTIIIGDSRRMDELKDESVHLIITSPPYWQLKDYGNGSQIGFNDSYEDYINNLNLVWKECYRVLHKGCRLCVNIGDQFARSVYYGRYKVIPIREEIIKFCETIGFDYMGAIIWQKVTTCNTTGGATIMGSFPYPRNGIIKLDYEFILIFKKLGDPSKVSRDIKENSKLTLEEWNEYFYGHWNFSGEKQDKHLAMFPEELPKRLIKMFSFIGDTVLDPFLGSGTTCLAAKKLGRNSIGYEVNEDFLPIIKGKLQIPENRTQSTDCIVPQPLCLFNEKATEERTKHKFEIILQKQADMDFKNKIKKLPYIFKDPVRFDKKIDPKKLKFGSKIDDSDSTREIYYSVKEIISPEIIVLNNDLKVRLIGIKEKKERNGEAMQFLHEKLKGQKVFLKFDTIKYDYKDNLLCYLFLKNKTFINAHLIKTGFTYVDISMEYKYKSKFVTIKKTARNIC